MRAMTHQSGRAKQNARTKVWSVISMMSDRERFSSVDPTSNTSVQFVALHRENAKAHLRTAARMEVPPMVACSSAYCGLLHAALVRLRVAGIAVAPTSAFVDRSVFEAATSVGTVDEPTRRTISAVLTSFEAMSNGVDCHFAPSLSHQANESCAKLFSTS